ncbi:MAG: hypothetical protein ACRD1K_20715 [Acidimicrobiales bacterium]
MGELRYIGDGSGLPEVPARNLSAAEIELFGGRLCKLAVDQAEASGDKNAIAAAKKLRPEAVLLGSGLYERTGTGPKAGAGESE